MNPAIETFLTAAFVVVLVSAAIAWAGRPVWLRIWQFLRRWYDEDRILEETQRQQVVYRADAMKEVDECLGPDELPASGSRVRDFEGKHAPQEQKMTQGTNDE
jgi:hypothetical protein